MLVDVTRAWRIAVLFLAGAALTGTAPGQTVRTWTSGSDQRWNRNQNWSGNNQPNADNEIAQFGTGAQLNPQLNANNLTVRGIRFSAGAGSYNVGDDNGARTLRIGNNSSGFVENLSAADQILGINTLQFQSDATIRTTGAGALTINSRLTGTNRDLTFNATAAGEIRVAGNITTGSGTLTKQGAGDLFLAGANTNTGQTSIDAGAIVLEASNVFANASVISISSGAALRLDGYSDTVARIGGAGSLDFGTGGSLTLGSGTSTFAGSFLGSGTLVIGSGATLTLGADFANANLNITLAGGTLRLAGHSFSAGTLNVTGNSVIDFAAGAPSIFDITGLVFGTGSLQLTVQNWTNAVDYFYSETGYVQGSAPLDQVRFQGWSEGDTKWQSYDSQITPVPEPSVYGATLLGLALAAGWWRRRRA